MSLPPSVRNFLARSARSAHPSSISSGGRGSQSESSAASAARPLPSPSPNAAAPSDPCSSPLFVPEPGPRRRQPPTCSRPLVWGHRSPRRRFTRLLPRASPALGGLPADVRRGRRKPRSEPRSAPHTPFLQCFPWPILRSTPVSICANFAPFAKHTAPVPSRLPTVWLLSAAPYFASPPDWSDVAGTRWFDGVNTRERPVAFWHQSGLEQAKNGCA